MAIERSKMWQDLDLIVRVVKHYDRIKLITIDWLIGQLVGIDWFFEQYFLILLVQLYRYELSLNEFESLYK